MMERRKVAEYMRRADGKLYAMEYREGTDNTKELWVALQPDNEDDIRRRWGEGVMPLVEDEDVILEMFNEWCNERATVDAIDGKDD